MLYYFLTTFFSPSLETLTHTYIVNNSLDFSLSIRCEVSLFLELVKEIQDLVQVSYQNFYLSTLQKLGINFRQLREYDAGTRKRKKKKTLQFD